MPVSNSSGAKDVRRIRGEVLHVVNRNADTLWSVMTVEAIRIDPSQERAAAATGDRLGSIHSVKPLDPAALPSPLTVVGCTSAEPGQIITAVGKVSNSNYGRQFKATSIVAENPVSCDGIARYLGSGVVDGIGPALAKRIVDAFGADTLRVIAEEPGRLAEINGIGPARSAAISEEWRSLDAERSAMLFFHSQGISGGLSRRIIQFYGDDAASVVRSNPYRLCSDVRGIGFKLADSIAKSLRVPQNSPGRIEAGIAYAMEEINTSGSTGIDEGKFIDHASKMLQVPAELVAVGLAHTVGSAEQSVGPDGAPYPLIRFGAKLYDATLARQESFIGKAIVQRSALRPFFADRFSPVMIDEDSRDPATGSVIKLSEEQRNAVATVFSNGVSIITGGPGCGKTTTLSVITRILERLKLSYAFAAPTGKAAQRISETTGREASTIHRLLELRPGTSEARKVTEDVLILDECSMVDVALMATLVRNLSRDTVLVLVGDADQLPSVGPGRVMGDLIESGCVATSRLNYVFRQGAESQIKLAAQAIRDGRSPDAFAGRTDGDLFILCEDNVRAISDAASLDDEEARPAAVARAAADIIVDLATNRIPSKYGRPWQDILILSPMNKGDAGVINLNRRLKESLNGQSFHAGVRPISIGFGGSAFGFLPGDRVIQTVNDYKLEIFNGDTGYVQSIDHKSRQIFVDFGRGSVAIPFDDLDALKPAYAITIHKSQGSEAPVVIIPMVTQHWTMLQRDLLYTGLTRAKSLAIIVGQKRAIAAAVRNIGGNNRTTRLLDALRAEPRAI